MTANASAAKRPVSISDAKRVANTAISGQFKYEVASTPQPTADTPTDFGIGKATRINRFTVDVVVGEFYGYDARGELMCSWTTRVFRTSTGQLNWRYKKDTECSLTGEPAKPLPN
ncbi:MAG TPA: hypothetical protein VE570_11295 [Thermoleophilaceae bacterium]|nr:hypothetical protein [Thermoleophilaceae bacterium]